MKLAALACVLLIAPTIAQNSPGDECIIEVTLHDELTKVTIAFDLLFDDAAWANLTTAIDINADGNLNATEISNYETRARQVASGELPEHRRITLIATFATRSGGFGDSRSNPTSALNETALINFEGPVNGRGKMCASHRVTLFLTLPVRLAPICKTTLHTLRSNGAQKQSMSCAALSPWSKP